jgi:hypothetical protein
MNLPQNLLRIDLANSDRPNLRYVTKDESGNYAYSIYSVNALRGQENLKAAQLAHPNFKFSLGE